MTDAGSTETRFCEVAGSSPWVDALWSFGAGEATASMIAADGCVDLIVHTRSDGSLRAKVHPPTARAHQAFFGAREQVQGVRMRVGFGAPLLARADTVEELVRQRGAGGLALSALEAIVSEVLDELRGPPPLLADFLDLVGQCRGTLRLGRGRTSPATERGLQRAAQTWIGLTPKALLRIERARAARRAIRQGQPLADAAAEFGYSDQAHLCREFRELLGVTPRALRPVGNLQDRAPVGR